MSVSFSAPPESTLSSFIPICTSIPTSSPFTSCSLPSAVHSTSSPCIVSSPICESSPHSSPIATPTPIPNTHPMVLELKQVFTNRRCTFQICPLQNPATLRRLYPILTGKKQFMISTMLFYRIKHGPWSLCLLTVMLLVVSGFPNLKRIMMVPFLVIKPGWSPRAFINKLAWIFLKHSALWLSQLLFVLFLLLL